MSDTVRITLQNLLPSTNYVLQVQASNDEEVSEWSPAFAFRTISDDTKPSVPQNVDAYFVGDSLRIEWSPVTTNVSGDTISINFYEVEIKIPSEPNGWIVSVPQNLSALVTLDIPFESMKTAFGMLDFSELDIRVRAVDFKNVKSDWSTTVNAQADLPEAPQNLVATPEYGAVSLKWDASTSEGVVSYIIYGGAVNPPTTVIGEVAVGTHTFYYPELTAIPLHFAIKAKSAFGTLSASSNVASATPIDVFGSDTTPPPATSFTSGSLVNHPNNVGATATLSWSASVADDLQGYLIEYRAVGATNWSPHVVGSQATTASIYVPLGNTDYEFKITAYDASGNRAATSSVYTVTKETLTAPSVPTGLTSSFSSSGATVRWNLVNESKVIRYDVEVATNSSFTSATQYRTTTNNQPLAGLSSGTTYYVRVRSVGFGDVNSAWSSTHTFTTPVAATTDGIAPPSVTGLIAKDGVGYVSLRWPAVANQDPVTYDVHVGTTSGFSVSAASLVTSISGTSAYIDALPNGTRLTPDTTYYFKVVARDEDGSAAASAAVSGKTTSYEDIAELPDKVNESIKSYVTEYAVNSSETTAPTTGWSTTTPTRTPGTFIWIRTKVVYQNDDEVTTSPALLTGNTGPSGAAGAPAPVVVLTATSQVIAVPAGGSPTPASVTVTGSAINTTISQWQFSVDGGSFTSSPLPAGVSLSGNTVTINGPSMTAKTITVKAGNAGMSVSDTLTVAKVSDGAPGTPGSPGTPGANGADAYTVILGNESHVFAGNTTGAIAASVDVPVIAYKGATLVAPTLGSATVVGGTAGISVSTSGSGTSQKYVVSATTALTTKSGTITMPITVDGKTFTKTFSWSLSLQGAAGNDGTPGTPGVSVTAITPYYAQVDGGATAPVQPTNQTTPPSPWQENEPAYVYGKDLYRTEKITYNSGSPTYTPRVKVSSYEGVNALRNLWGHPSNTTLIDGRDIYTGTVKAEAISIGDFTNLIADAGLNDESFSNWSGGGLIRVPAADINNPAYIEWSASVSPSNAHIFNNNMFECELNDKFYVSFEYSTPAENTANVTLVAAIQTKTPTNTTAWPQVSAGSVPPGTNWTFFEGVITINIPQATRGQFDPFATSSIAGQKVRLRKMQLRRMDKGKLLVDGTVKASVLEAGSTFTNNLNVASTFTLGSGGVIQSSVFNANTGFQLSSTGLIIRGNGQVAVEAIQGGSISAKTISLETNGFINLNGGMIQTSATASRGVEISSAGIKAFTSTGVKTFDLTASDGSVWLGTGSTLVAPNITVGTGSITGTGFSLSNTGLVLSGGQITGQFSLNTSGDLRSSNYSTSGNGLGWQILGTGAAEFANLKVRGSAIVGVAGDSSYLGSATPLGTNAGWRIYSNGYAEFNYVKVRGEIQATSGSFSGNITSTATITGGTFQTNTTGVNRTVINSSGIQVFGPFSASTPVFSVLSSTGDIVANNATLNSGTFTGNITATTGTITGATINGGVFNSTSSTSLGDILKIHQVAGSGVVPSYGRMEFMSSRAKYSGEVYAYVNTSGAAQLVIKPPTPTANTVGVGTLTFTAGSTASSTTLFDPQLVTIRSGVSGTSPVYVEAGALALNPNSGSATIWGPLNDSNDLWIRTRSAGLIYISSDNSMNWNMRADTGRNVTFGGNIDVPNMNSGNGATLTINNGSGTNWRIRYVSSTIKVKTNIEPLDISPEVILSLSPRRYDRTDFEPDEPTGEIGFIAEEAEGLGLTPWVIYDGNNECWSFDYLRWGVALQIVARHQRDQIEELESKNQALESRLAAIETMLGITD